jgi:hypothetical protein
MTIYFLIILSTFSKTFITDSCTSDNDCFSDCCGFNTGKCAGPIIALERDGGCGFGDPRPNSRAANNLRFTPVCDCKKIDKKKNNKVKRHRIE